MKLFRLLITSRLIASVVLLTLFATGAPAVHAIGEHREKTAGVMGGYNTRNESAVAGLFFSYRFNRLLRIAPDVTYIFENRNVDGMAFNINFHMPLPIIPSGRFNLYPLAGVNYTSWSFHHKDNMTAETDDVSTRKGRFGVNLGGGIDVYATPTLKLFVEGKYIGVKHYSAGSINVGIGYIF